MKYTIAFTVEELALISSILVERPYKQVSPLIDNINAQIRALEKPALDLPSLPKEPQ